MKTQFLATRHTGNEEPVLSLVVTRRLGTGVAQQEGWDLPRESGLYPRPAGRGSFRTGLPFWRVGAELQKRGRLLP